MRPEAMIAIQRVQVPLAVSRNWGVPFCGYLDNKSLLLGDDIHKISIYGRSARPLLNRVPSIWDRPPCAGACLQG